MKIIKYIITIILLSFFNYNYLFSQQVYTNSEFLKISKDNENIRTKKKFKFSKKKFFKRIDFNKIDTNAIYILHYIDKKISPKDSIYQFYRFFTNAVFHSGPYFNLINSEDAENLSYGTWKCYTMNKKDYVIIEIPKQFQMDGNWVYFYGKVLDNQIALTHYYGSYPPFVSSPGYLKPKLIYKKSKINFRELLKT